MNRDSTKPTGRNGGKRPGAGRPRGALSALKYGEVKALKVCGLRVPDTATPDDARLADMALDRAIDVMLGNVHADDAGNVLRAATYVRAQVCEPNALTDGDGEALTVQIIRKVTT